METNENCSTEEVKPLICKEIESEGFVKTWEKYNVKHKTYFKATSWLFKLLWLLFAIVIIAFFVKIYLLSKEDFKDMELFRLADRREELIRNLTLWASLTIIMFLLSATADTVPDIIKNYLMTKWIDACGVDLTIFIKRKNDGGPELPPDMDMLIKCLYFNKNKDKNALRIIAAAACVGGSVILSIIILFYTKNAVACYTDFKIWESLGANTPKPDDTYLKPFIVALVLDLITGVAKVIFTLITGRAAKNWASSLGKTSNI